MIELIVVVAIVAALVSMVVVSLQGAMQATQLTTAGNRVTQIFELARQRAMSGNVLTAAVLLTNLNTTEDGRALTVLEFVPANPSDPSSQPTWKQITEWTILPNGIVADLNSATATANTFLQKTPTRFPFATTDGAPVGYLGYKAPLPTGSYAARVFLPAGGLLNPGDAAQLQIVQGTVSKGVTTYQEKKGPVNYYRISLIGATGRTKVDRPSL